VGYIATESAGDQASLKETRYSRDFGWNMSSPASANEQCCSMHGASMTEPVPHRILYWRWKISPTAPDRRRGLMVKQGRRKVAGEQRVTQRAPPSGERRASLLCHKNIKKCIILFLGSNRRQSLFSVYDTNGFIPGRSRINLKNRITPGLSSTTRTRFLITIKYVG